MICLPFLSVSHFEQASSDPPSPDEHAPPRVTLLHLPNELLTQVFVQLRPVDALAITQTCSTFRRMTEPKEGNLLKAYLQYRSHPTPVIDDKFTLRSLHITFMRHVRRVTCNIVSQWHAFLSNNEYRNESDAKALCEACEDEHLERMNLEQGSLTESHRRDLLKRALTRNGLLNIDNPGPYRERYIEGYFTSIRQCIQLM